MTETKAPGVFVKAYLALFGFIAQNRILKKDIELRQVHSVLISALTTSPMMWAYAFLVVHTADSELYTYIGLAASLIHMVSPLIFLFSNSAFLVINTMLFGGTLFITASSYFTGGFESFGVLWYVSTPMLGGMASGRKGATLWAVIGAALISAFFILTLSGYEFPNVMTPDGLDIARYFLVFGWFILGSVLSFLFVTLRNISDERLKKQTEKVDSLFRILFHDLANSLGRINIGHTIARRDSNGLQCTRGLEIAGSAAETMIEITQNVRKMYAVSQGKAEMELCLHPLTDSLQYVEKIFAEDLEKKKMRIHWDKKNLEGLRLLVEPCSFKNQVLANILSNAIKFSPEESIIHVAAYPVNHHYYAVEIKDAGIGMPPVILDQLFDLNKKTSRPGTNGEFGTGFGMHIMKSFVEIYQGQVKVESIETNANVPSGTTFRLILKGEWG